VGEVKDTLFQRGYRTQFRTKICNLRSLQMTRVIWNPSKTKRWSYCPTQNTL